VVGHLPLGSGPLNCTILVAGAVGCRGVCLRFVTLPVGEFALRVSCNKT
jgi:hypothetical protein